VNKADNPKAKKILEANSAFMMLLQFVILKSVDWQQNDATNSGEIQGVLYKRNMKEFVCGNAGLLVQTDYFEGIYRRNLPASGKGRSSNTGSVHIEMEN
jgi:hypothetical protein